MNEETVNNWILKAENDLKTGKDEMDTNKPAFDTICFHMQQCVEKYLKCFLIFNGKEIKKTHNLAEIINECSETDADYENMYNIRANELTKYAVDIRYGDEFYFPALEETKQAIQTAEKVKDFVRKKLEDKGMKFCK